MVPIYVYFSGAVAALPILTLKPEEPRSTPTPGTRRRIALPSLTRAAAFCAGIIINPDAKITNAATTITIIVNSVVIDFKME